MERKDAWAERCSALECSNALHGDHGLHCVYYRIACISRSNFQVGSFFKALRRSVTAAPVTMLLTCVQTPGTCFLPCVPMPVRTVLRPARGWLMTAFIRMPYPASPWCRRGVTCSAVQRCCVVAASVAARKASGRRNPNPLSPGSQDLNVPYAVEISPPPTRNLGISYPAPRSSNHTNPTHPAPLHLQPQAHKQP